jgi:outer membrane immunogenic protein
MSSSFSLKVLAASLLFASTTGLALAAHHHKAVANYKDEVQVAPCPAPTFLKDGFYVGVQGGYDIYGVHEQISLPIGTALAGNTNSRSAGWVGGLFLGYGRVVWNNFYIGTEFFGNYNGASTNYSLNSATLGSYASKFTTKSSYGISILPGYKITNETLGYVRLGYNWAKFKTQENSTSTVTYASMNNTSSGFNYGVGLETLVYKNWSARAEYTYTNYTSFNSAMGTSFSSSDNQFMLGLIYHIA